MEYETGQVTRQGNRSSNQDRLLVAEEKNAILLVVADGMGGHPRGEQAAQYAVDTCKVRFQNASKPLEDPQEFLSKTFKEAHRHVIQYGKRQRPPISPRTTCVAVLIQNGEAWIAHLGDSRVYVFRKGGTLFRTRDHSYVEKLLEEGKIKASEKETHPKRNSVTRCIGGSKKAPQVSVADPILLQERDVILLCSDGLWNGIKEKTLSASLSGPQPLAEQITDLAKQAVTTQSPSSDNVTATSLRWFSAI